MITSGIGVFSYSLDRIDNVQALALDNKSELDQRAQAVLADLPEIKQEVKQMSSNIIKLCINSGIECQ